MRRLAEALLILLLFDSVARADGVVIPSRAVAEPVRTPDQRALVAFDGSTETLVVETTFEGAGRDFAWIVPLPAKPVVEESTTGLFPTLEVLSAPRVPRAAWQVTTPSSRMAMVTPGASLSASSAARAAMTAS